MENMNKLDDLDRSGRLMIIVLALIESLLMLLAHDGIEDGWAPFTSTLGRTLWFSLGIALPLVAALLLKTGRDVYALLATAVVALLLLPLAWHTGNACLLHGPVECSLLFMPYVFALIAGLFILLPYLQSGRDYGWRSPYAELFHHAWDNFLVIAATALFTGAGWLILVLWAGLFDVIGIDFFKVLFKSRHFIYPVTGLFAGFGLMLARTQRGALRSVLKVLLALGRGLLPLISILAVVFLIALTFTGLQQLWATRHAASLLLSLILFSVVLINAAFQDGAGPAPASVLRNIVTAALLTLPIYAVISAIALQLRIAQYGWSVDRLWAAWFTGVALLYAGSYAFAVFSREPWLGRIASANKIIALLIAGSLLLTQSSLLDFRRITLNSQLAQLDKGVVTLEKFDLAYLRWDLGQPGYEALQALSRDARVKAAPDMAKRIQQLLEAKNRWDSREHAAFTAEDFMILPKGTALPEGVLTALNEKQKHRVFAADQCASKAKSCALLAVDLNNDAQPEWVLVNTENGGSDLLVLGLRNGNWQQIGNLRGTGDYKRVQAVLKTLQDAAISTESPRWKDLRIDQVLFHFQPWEQPP